MDGAEKRERFDEALAVIRAAWSGEPVTFQGRYQRVDGVSPNVLPLQRPHPPIYVAVLRAEAAYHVGRQGNRLMAMPYASVDRMEEIGDLVRDFERGWGEAGAGDAQGAVLVASTPT